MADGCALENSIIVEDYFAYPQTNSDAEGYPTPRAANLIYLNEEFAWKGTFDELKALVKYDLKLKGNWTSPGGPVKQFTGCNHTIKWHGKSRKKLSIVSDGDSQSLLKNLENLATTIADKPNTNSELGHEENMAGENKISHNFLTCSADGYSQQTKNICEHEADTASAGCCYYNEFATKINRIEDKIKLLQNRMDAHDIDSECTIPCESDLSLRRQNVRLQSELESAKSTIKQLKSTVNKLQSEKSSLTTVIRLLQEDNLQHVNHSDRNNNATNDKQKNEWDTVKSKKPKKRTKKPTHATKEKLPTASTSVVTEENPFQSLSNGMPEELNISGYVNDEGETQKSNNTQEEQTGSHVNDTKPTKVIIAGDSMISLATGRYSNNPNLDYNFAV